ncbi:MAG TPA: winged helix-turn-helix transcriptional regulator, partial [Acidimicrobiia bacterium]|nr:winged helix-turn-helix transcriptional regulator [Acidimicrobiia bacterium]
LTGTTRFNELIRGNPGLSRALLSRRLDQLERAGVIEHDASGEYRLTDAGLALQPVVFGLAEWGAQFAFGDPDPEELDPDLLLWWLHHRIDADSLPQRRFVVHVSFSDDPKNYWIVVEQEPSLCLVDPGFDVDVVMRSDTTTLYRTYLGHQTLRAAYNDEQISLIGSTAAVRSFMKAFQQSPVGDLVAAASDRRG